jgi:hypothetical protein
MLDASGSPTYCLEKHLTELLTPLIRNTPHHVRNCSDFIQIINSPTVRPEDIMVIFDVVSLFTCVPVKETLDVLDQQFGTDIMSLFHFALTLTYFLLVVSSMSRRMA